MKKKYLSLTSGGNDNLFSFERFILIGVTIFLSKIVLILTAYFFNENDYNTFNRAYYTASILILFGTLGINYAFVKMKTSFRFIFYTVAFNVLSTFVILLIVSHPNLSTAEYFSVLVYSIFACLGGIIVFKILFEGDYKKYFLLMIANSILHVAIIPLVINTNAGVFTYLPFITLFWFMIILLSIRIENCSESDLKEVYKVGISSFIINGSVPFALAADKFIVNNFFILDTANAYTFCWAITAPLFYIGNLVERIIYSSKEKDSEHVFKKSLLLLLGLIVIYTIAAVIVVFLFPSLLPRSLDLILFRKIFLFMISGYSIYVLFHFPINGYLFKFLNTDVQKHIARIFAILIVLLVTAFITFIGLYNLSDFRLLLFIIWGYIFTLLFIKWYIIYRKRPAINA